MTMMCSNTYDANRWSTNREASLVRCFREVDALGRHKGSHQGWQDMPAGEYTTLGKVTRWGAWQQLWTWSEGGASGSSRDPGCQQCLHDQWRPGSDRHEVADHALIECPQCGALHDPFGHFRDNQMQQAPTGSCFQCALWWVRAGWFAGRLRSPSDRRRGIRPHDHSEVFGGTGRLYSWCPGGHGAFAGRRYSVRWDDGTEVGPDDVLWDGGAIPWWWLDAFPPNGVITYHHGKVAT
jgi:hypothetical protein